MNLEDRLRAGLNTPMDADEDQFLDAVRRGAGSRRRRRAGAALAAGALVVAGAAGIAVGVQRDDAAPPRPPATRTPSPTLPAEAARGVIDLVVNSPGEVYRLTTNVGCVACTTVWAQAPGGDWIRVHDFGSEAYDGPPQPVFGPVTNLVMQGSDGWAWGNKLFSTHDGGRTWSEVGQGPGRRTEAGHSVVIAGRFAWSLFRSIDAETVLYRSPVDADEWTEVPLPDGKADNLVRIGDAVVLDVQDEGLSNRRLRTSTDGVRWSRLAAPCLTDSLLLTAGRSAFLECPGKNGGALFRSTGLGPWQRFGGTIPARAGVFALGEDRVLLNGPRSSTLVTDGGTVRVSGLPGGAVTSAGSAEDLAYAVAFGEDSVGRLHRSSDGGRTWTQVE
ncbi:MAG: hypothetical protein J7518_20555 [Nocardioidaceae bacterium]|nr:hypothetical protein [Nocardioidaceae bacterium]